MDAIQYPALTQPVGDPSIWVEPVFAEAWIPSTNQAVLGLEYRHTLPALFFVGEPDDFAPPVVVPDSGWVPETNQDAPRPVEYTYQIPSVIYQGEPIAPPAPSVPDSGWMPQANQPVLPLELRYLLQSLFYQGDPADFVAPIFLADFIQPTNQAVLPVEYRHLLESLFKPDSEEIISTPDLVNFAEWVPPTNQPVLPIEYRYMLPYLFVQVEPGDFVAASPFVQLKQIESLGDLRSIQSLGDIRFIDSLGDWRRVQRG